MPYPVVTHIAKIDQLLGFYRKGILDRLGEQVVGLYLFGSLTYGDFIERRSDIDLLVIVEHPVNRIELASIRELHTALINSHKKWAPRLECSYTPRHFLKMTLPPKEPRPWYDGNTDHLWEQAPYGNEWIINNYLLYKHGITLFGPNFKTFMDAIAIAEVQKACLRDLFEEWEPKLQDPQYLENSHYQSYLVLNLCRILYTVLVGAAGSKSVSADWVKRRFGSPYHRLIEEAQSWGYGKEIENMDLTRNFIRFTIDQVSKTSLFGEMETEVSQIRSLKRSQVIIN